MNRTPLFLTICLLLAVSSCCAQKINHKLQEFEEDFSFANHELNGHLMLFGEYQGNLTSLTYERYLQLLKGNEVHSTKGIAKRVQSSDDNYFIAKKNTFYIVIYSKSMNVVIFDNASTTLPDSVKTLNPGETVPDLQSMIPKSIVLP